jgi:hypothetical protein
MSGGETSTSSAPMMLQPYSDRKARCASLMFELLCIIAEGRRT